MKQTKIVKPNPRWENKRVVVTGGSMGLGFGLATALRRYGAEVAIIARNGDRAEAAAKAIGATAIPGDVADKFSVHRIAAAAVLALGGVDVLIHNASSLGPVPLRLLADTDCEDLELALLTNVTGPFRLTKALLSPLLLGEATRGPRLVVQISSDAAVNAYPTWGAYSASKAAADHLSRIFDAELRAQGVRFLAIDPGDMATSMHSAAAPGDDPKDLHDPIAVGADLADFLTLALDEGIAAGGCRLSAAAWRAEIAAHKGGMPHE